MDWKWVLLLPHILSFYITLGSEVIVQVNTKKWIYYVPERFLSLTVDPLTLAAASPLTQESYNMAKGLSPSFVRIGGIGTNAVIFGKEFMVNSSTVSESQWDSVNDFAKGTGLDIIASLNPSIQDQGVWDSKNSVELISYSNKKRYSVVWQLGYDVRGYNATGAEIGRDLVGLAKILDGFPKYAGSPVFSPDISSVSGAKQIHFVKDLLTTAGNSLGSIILQPQFLNDGEPEDPFELIASMTNELDIYVWNKEVRVGKSIPKKPVWIAEPTASKGSFRDTMKFVKRIGAAARMGTQIYMRQAGAVSLKSPTPEFWFSLLYKNLVGQGVLDNKIVSQNQSDVHIFAHCTASVPEERSVLDSDWNYEKGAVTVFGVNESPEPVKLVLKVTSKEEPLHIYILTSGEKNERGKNPTLLNGQELMLSPTWDLPVLSPKVKRPNKSSSVMLPGGSIFFVVLPDSKIRTCSVPPLATPDFNLSELSKRLRLGPPKKAETLEGEQEIEPSDDMTDEGVYVTFVKKKRHDVEAKNNNNPRLDIIGKSLVQTIISKLAPKKIDVKTNKPVNEGEMPVYITFNEHSFLNKLADGIKEELKEEDQLEFDAKKDKYAPLTAAMTDARQEESSSKSEAVRVEPDVIKIEPVVETSSVPALDSEPEKIVSRMRRSSNEDPLPASTRLNDETPLKIEVTMNESKKKNNANKRNVRDDAHHLDHVLVSEVNPAVSHDKVDDKTRSARHIGDGKEEESEDLNAERISDDAKKVTAGEEISEKEKDGDDVEDVKNKTLELARVVEETEKIENISESPEGVVVPPEVSERKLDEILLETAKSKSEPEPDSDAERKEARLSIDEVEVSNDKIPSSSSVEPPVATPESGLSLSPGYSHVSTSGQSQPGAPNSVLDTSQIQLSATEQQPTVPVVTNGDHPEGQVSSGSQVVSNPIIIVPQPQQRLQQMVPTSSKVRDNHILKISLPIPPNNDQPHGLFSVGNEEFYNERKEIAINNILSRMVKEEDSKSSIVSPGHDGKPVVTEGQLVVFPLPGNDKILMDSEDVKLLGNHRGAPENVKTLENGDPIELPNEEDVPKMVMPRQVTIPRTLRISVTPLSQTATLSTPAELTVASTPASPVSPFKSSVDSNSLKTNQIREPLKASSPDELREKFKSLREKMLELRSQYVAAREKRLEEIKKQVASRGPVPSSEGDDPIKSTIKRREAKLKEWFKKFDKRETQTSQELFPIEEKIDEKSRPRRLSLFTNDEGLDMAKFFEEEPPESYNYKRSPEMSILNSYQHDPKAPDGLPHLPKISPSGKRIFPLDSKTHGIVYNNKIYPAKLFSYIDQPDFENTQNKIAEPINGGVPTRIDEHSEDSKFDGLTKNFKTSMEMPKSRERIAFVPKEAFLREMKSDFIPVIIIPPDDSESGKAEDLSPGRAKRSTLDSLEDRFHQLKEELLPKISSWIKDLSDKAPWKRDLEQSSRTRRSVEDFIRTNELRSLLIPKSPSRADNTGVKDIENFVVNNIDKGENEMYAVAKKYGTLTEKIGEDVLKEEPKKSDDMGYCEEIGTSKESIIRDPFEKSYQISTSAKRGETTTKMEDRSVKSGKIEPVSSPESFEESVFASVIAEKIKDFFTTVTNWFGISPTDR